MAKNNAVVGVYDSHTKAEASIKELQRSGFDMKKLSIVGKDYHTEEHVIGYYNAGDRMKVWGKLGAFWGGLWGMLFGSAFFLIPGIGPIMVFGPLVGWIVAALEGAVVVGGLSALGAGLYSIGMPKDSIVKYETALKSDKFLVIAHGTADEVDKAKSILKTTGAAEITTHEGVLAKYLTCCDNGGSGRMNLTNTFPSRHFGNLVVRRCPHVRSKTVYWSTYLGPYEGTANQLVTQLNRCALLVHSFPLIMEGLR